MNRPLTNDEIRDLPSLGIRGGPTYSISCRAQEMIRELQEENEHRKLSVEHQITKRALAEAENAKLEGEVRDLLESRAKIVRGMYDAEDEFRAENANLRERAHGWYACYKGVREQNVKLWEALDLLINCPAMADARALLARKEAALKGDNDE